MLVARLEHWPDGDEARRKPVGEVRIVSDGGDRDVGHYRVELIKNTDLARREGPWRAGKVLNFKRQLLGAYDLLFRGLAACIAGRHIAEASSIPEDSLLFFPASETEAIYFNHEERKHHARVSQ